MGPLFWRIFVALWAGSALLMVGTAALVALRAEQGRPDIVHDQFVPMIRMVGAGALAGEPAHARQMLQDLESTNGTEIYLFDPQGRERFGRAMPAPLPGTPSPTQEGPAGGRHVQPLEIPGTVADAAGVRYRMVAFLELPPPPSPRWLLWRLAGPILVSVLLTGLVSALVARYLVSPLARLRAATSRLGAGDLHYRIGNVLRPRKDEFAALAADFDRMAERIDQLVRSQRQLLLDLSHELRSPLARLRVALELSRDPVQPQASLLTRMERDVERMDVLIGELLLLARVEWSGARREFVPVNLVQLVEEIVDDARLEAAHTGHDLDYRVDASPLNVCGDQELLRRAVENIVRNALQHTPPGTRIQVTIGTAANEACIRVQDDGPGIAEDRVEQLFVPFARGDDAATHGYGLGLAISRGAVHQHGGRIETHGAGGSHGLVVTICLPLAA